MWLCLAPLHQEPDPDSNIPMGAKCHKEWQTLWTQYSNALQADCLTCNSVYGETFFWCNFWNIFFQAMHISQDHKLAPYVNHRSSPSYFLPWSTCTTLWLRMTDRVGRAGAYGSTHPADSTAGTGDLAQRLKQLGSDTAVTHHLQSTAENLGFTWWTSHERTNDMVIIILSFPWNNFEWKCLRFL